MILKITSKLLAIIFIAKIVYWLQTDLPISRGSMLILALFIIFFIVRNKFTYFLLAGLAVFCIAYKYTYQDVSGYLIVDFMASFSKPMQGISEEMAKLPYIFYYFTIFLIMLPTTIRLYFNSKKS